MSTTNKEESQRQQLHSDQPQLEQQQQQKYLPIPQQVDVRMKRHPELQPYIPSDRDRIHTNNRPSKKTTVIASANDAKPSLTKPKKCVSMTRLDQLARPKKVFTKPATVKPEPVKVQQRLNPAPLPKQPTPTVTPLPKQPTPVVTPPPKQPTQKVTPLPKQPTQKVTPLPKQLTPQPTPKQQQSTPQQQLPEKQQEARRVSLNDDHYQSAASDLLQDNNETSTTNGLSFSKTMGLALCDELEAELIAEGIVSKQPNELFKQSNYENNHKSPALLKDIVKESTPKPRETSRDDEEKRLRAEEELKEFARREDQERQSRASLVDSILSRVQNTSS